MPKSASEGYNVKLINVLYHQIPAFTDIFDEESFYTFVACFVAGTLVLVFLVSRFVTLKPVDW